MSKPTASQLFKEANDLWFLQGLTHRALERYQAAVSSDPTDPVALYQLAQALWALSRLDEARATIAEAQRYQHWLSPLGIKLVAEVARKLANPSPFRIALPIAPTELDADQLETKGLSDEQWHTVAYGASEREMFGLAAYAFSRVGRPFRVLELDEDEREMENEAQKALNRLSVMRVDTEQTAHQSIKAPLINTRSAELFTSPQASQVPNAPHPLPTTPIEAPPSQIAFSPLILTTRITPQNSEVGKELLLLVTLTNKSAQMLAVNKRLLLNHPNAPPGYSEIFLKVEGPPGYENMVRYHVRAGLPQPDQLVVLPPQQGIEKAYDLVNYESFHLQGIYRVSATYQNTIHRTVQDIPVFVGTLSSQICIIERI